MEPPQEQAEILSFSALSTPVGSMRYGGRLYNTRGTGFSRYRVHGMFALVQVLGKGRYRDKLGYDRRLGPGDLIVVFPELAHQYGPEGDDIWDEVFVSFDGAAFEGWRAFGLDPAHPVWSLPDSGYWTERFLDILRQPLTSRAEACAAANSIHLLIADALAARPLDASTHPWLESACQALSCGLGAQSLQEIAESAGLGYETFRKIFRKETGDSPAHYRRRMRLAQAAIMMQRSDLSLEMIAGALDFCDAFHLSKAFKHHYGYSPALHRRRIQAAGE